MARAPELITDHLRFRRLTRQHQTASPGRRANRPEHGQAARRYALLDFLSVSRRPAFRPLPQETTQTHTYSHTDVEKSADLLPEGANPGTVPTDLEQATGLERLEILGKMQGIDVFDMKPLPGDRVGTLDDPIMVKSAGEEQYCGCRGVAAGGHRKIWIVVRTCTIPPRIVGSRESKSAP